MLTHRLGNRSILLLASSVLTLGLIAGGYLLGDGLKRARLADRAVTMRGLAERDVVADLATWTVTFSEQGTEFESVQAAIDADTRTVQDFFRRAGFADADLTTAGAGISRMRELDGPTVITIRRTLQLRTRDVMRARAAYARQFDLIRNGVLIEEGSAPTYSFTKLDQVKPPMIAAATRDARRAAQQFAADSGTAVGAIRSATQGYFSIGARHGEDGGSGSDSPLQKVRVVTTIEFYLD